MDAKNNIKASVSHQLAKLKWNDKAIQGLSNQDINNRRNIPFDTSGNLKGMHLRYSYRSGKKVFYLIGKVKGTSKTFFHKCGEFQLGITGTFEIEQYVNKLILDEECKNRDGEWIKKPNEEKITKKLIQQTQSHTIRQAIQKIARESFPHIKQDGTIDKKSIQQYSQFLFGWNKRRLHLTFTDDAEGCGVLGLKDNMTMTWDKLWRIYKPYEDCDHPTKRSLYDSQLGGLCVDELTPRIVQNWCNKGETYGARQNRLKAFQYLYRACNKLNLLAGEDKLDPTRVKHGGVVITYTKKKVSKNHKYNDMKFKEAQIEKIIDAAVALRDEHPFQAEAVMFILYSSRRQEESLKLTLDDLWKHKGKPHNRVITLPANITKSRSEEYVVITEGIQKVLDSLSYQRAKPEYKKYAHIKWLFPRRLIASHRCGDIDFCKSDDARTKNLESVWKKIVKQTGIDGQKKLFRKSLSTIATDTLGSTDKAIAITGHKNTATLEKFYYKSDIDDHIKYADDVAKVYSFKKK